MTILSDIAKNTVILLTLLTSLLMIPNGADADNVEFTCNNQLAAYHKKGLEAIQSPQVPIKGIGGQQCTLFNRFTCCTREMERKMHQRTKRMFNTKLQSSLEPLLNIVLEERTFIKNNFVEFVEMTQKKESKMFRMIYGMLFQKMKPSLDKMFESFKKVPDDLNNIETNILSDLYSELGLVLHGAVMHQDLTNETYNDCVKTELKNQKLFGGDFYRKMKRLKESFRILRAYYQGIVATADALQAIVDESSFSGACSDRLSTLLNCMVCKKNPQVIPCPNHCIQIMDSCLPFTYKYGQIWPQFIADMAETERKFYSKDSSRSLLGTLGLTISEGILSYQEASHKSIKVNKNCGGKFPVRRGRSADHRPLAAQSYMVHKDSGRFRRTVHTTSELEERFVFRNISNNSDIWNGFSKSRCMELDGHEDVPGDTTCWTGDKMSTVNASSNGEYEHSELSIDQKLVIYRMEVLDDILQTLQKKSIASWDLYKNSEEFIMESTKADISERSGGPMAKTDNQEPSIPCTHNSSSSETQLMYLEEQHKRTMQVLNEKLRATEEETRLRVIEHETIMKIMQERKK